MLLNKILKTKSSSEPATPIRLSSSELDDTPENPNKITTLPKTFTSNLDENTESFIKPITHFLESDEDELILISTSSTSSTISDNETSISLTPSRSSSSKSNDEIETYFRPISPPKSSTSELEDSPGTSSTVAQTLLDLDEGTSSTPPKSSILLS